MSVASQPTVQLARVLLVDDHQLLLEALSFVMAPHYEVSCISSLRQVEFAFATFRPHVLVIDTSMPDGDGISAGHRFARKFPNLKVIYLSMDAGAKQMRRAMDGGAHGFVLKKSSAQELLHAVDTVLKGGQYLAPEEIEEPSSDEAKRLTERQLEVLRLVARGFSAKEIATHLDISVRTAEFHRGSIMQRLKIHSTALLTRYAVQAGLI